MASVYQRGRQLARLARPQKDRKVLPQVLSDGRVRSLRGKKSGTETNSCLKLQTNGPDERARRVEENGKKGKRREPSQLNDEENEFLNDPFPQPDPGVSNSRREQTDGGSNKQAAIGAPRERPTASLGFCAHVFFVLHLNPFRTSFFFFSPRTNNDNERCERDKNALLQTASFNSR